MPFISVSSLSSIHQAESGPLNLGRVEQIQIILENAGWKNQIVQDLWLRNLYVILWEADVFIKGFYVLTRTVFEGQTDLGMLRILKGKCRGLGREIFQEVILGNDKDLCDGGHRNGEGGAKEGAILRIKS